MGVTKTFDILVVWRDDTARFLGIDNRELPGVMKYFHSKNIKVTSDELERSGAYDKDLNVDINEADDVELPIAPQLDNLS